ncbi:hypothetical protein SAMN04489844_0486 [Nocardioides exalbidus]|uniref:Bacterial Ig-like domain-containing protein n=1 Tax=Nocardioides exalbidus TaxID=402596 RepID=A0A1H4K925_9ACTN|nr:Ig-like domain-containing protein [Nocardioides exalbidus]SEB54907.1 hypothetical protein SAMN04489844_0486 [Nocardioides exalbidus]
MPLRHRLAGVTALTLAASLPALVQAPAHAGALGAGETVISGATTAVGVGESVAAGLHDGRTLVVWEGARNVASGNTQGVKREVYGRILDASGAATGPITLLASMGATDDATQDATDPAVATLPDGKVALVFAGDVLADTTGAPTPTDTTSWQVLGGILDPGALTKITPTALTAVAPTNPAYDQQHPDVTLDQGQLRVVWDGDTATTGDGTYGVWTTRVPFDLSGTPTITQVGTGTRPRVASVNLGGQRAAIIWEGAGPERRIQVARVTNGVVTTVPSIGASAPAGAAIEQLSPDIRGGSDYRVVWSSNSAGSGYQVFTALFGDNYVADAGTAVTSGAHDTWPTVAGDPAQGQDVISFARRTSTAGTGHYEVMSGRVSGTSLVDLAQVSTTDADMSYDNAESMRPALATYLTGAVQHVWSRVRSDAVPGVAIRRSAALVDLATTISVSPARPSPARAGVNAADTVTVTVGYGTTAASVGRVASRLTLAFPGFTQTGSTVTGPAVFSAGGWDVPAMNPGAGGTITLTGSLDAAAEGTVRTATATVAPVGLVVDDPATNDTATASTTVDYAPQVTGITRSGSTPTNASSVAWQVTFDQVVSGVLLDDFQLATTGGLSATLASVTCAGASSTTCTVTATLGSGAGDVALVVPAGATATDASNKSLATGNLPFTGPAYTVDRQPPSVTTTALGPDPTNASQIEFRLDFSEPVTQPQAAQLTITGGTFASVVRTNAGTGPTDSWTVRVTPSADGQVTLRPGAGTSSDAAGNPSTAGTTTASRTSDRTAPVMTLTGPTGPQRTAYDVTVSASETVTGLTLGDFTVTGGTADQLTGAGPWTVHVVPATEGPVVLRLPAGSVTDAAGNGNAIATSTTTYDATRPDVTVASAAGERTGDNPIVFTLTFTEPVTGLTAGELTVTNGTASLSGTGATRTVSVVPSADGPVSVAVPADVAVDGAGNTNTAGSAVSRTYDTTGPTPQITTSASSPTNAASFPVTITWPEAVTGFTAADVVVTRGTPSGFTAGPGNTWTLSVAPTGDGQVSVAVPAGVAQDLADNASLAGTTLTVDSDRTAPSVVLSSSAGDPVNDAITVDVTFSEPVSGLGLGAFTTDNAVASNLTGSGTSFSVTLTPEDEGTFGVSLAAGAAADAAGNATLAGTLLERTYDTTATADLAYTGPALVNAPITLTLTLSDDATISAGDFDTTNGTVTSVAGGPRVFDVVLAPTTDGSASVRLPAGTWTDDAGNANTASDTVAVTYDATSPTVSSLRAPATATTAYDVDVTFSEPVLSLSTALVAVTNGSASQVTGSGTDWSFRVTPSSDGDVTVSVGAGAATDAAGNPSVASGAVSTTYDTTVPVLTVSSPTGAVVTTSPVPVVIAASETVTGLDPADLVATNATVTNLVGGGNRWTADLVPASEGTVGLRVVAGATEDQAGIPSAASNTLTREFDSTRPTLALTSPVSGVTTASTIPVTATFSKAVLGFEESDLRVAGATLSGFTKVDARTWTFVLAATADGDVSVTVPELAAASAGGNLAFGASYAVRVDRTAPVLRVSGPSSVTEAGPVTFTVTAGEAVTGLDGDDLSVSGSARSSAVTLTPVAGTTWQATVTGMTAAGDVTLAIRGGAVTDAAGNTSAAASGTAAWRPAGRLTSLRLLQRPGNREANRVALPLEVVGSDVTFTATSSNERVLPASAISVTGSGTVRQLTLAGRAEATGASTVVVTATAGSATRTVRLRFVVDGDGDERLVGSRGIDVMLARHGDDVLLGKGGDDHLYGGFGDDRLVGGAGDDVLVGGPGADALVGGKGADLFVAWGKDDVVDPSKKQGDRVLRPSRAERRLLGP